MKRLLIALLLLLAAPAWAEEPVQLARMSGPMLGAGVSAAACSTPSGDELSEGFGATPDVTWTAVTLTPEYGHTLQAGAPEGSCGTGLHLLTSSSAGRERIYWDRGSTIATNVNVDIVFSIYMNDGMNPDTDGTTRAIVGFASTNEGFENTIFVHNPSGTLKLNNVVVSRNTWYTVTMHLDATASDSYVIIDGGGSTTCDVPGECKFTRDADPSRYLVIGRNTYFDDALDFEIGYITINTP